MSLVRPLACARCGTKLAGGEAHGRPVPAHKRPTGETCHPFLVGQVLRDAGGYLFHVIQIPEIKPCEALPRFDMLAEDPVTSVHRRVLPKYDPTWQEWDHKIIGGDRDQACRYIQVAETAYQDGKAPEHTQRLNGRLDLENDLLAKIYRAYYAFGVNTRKQLDEDGEED